MYTGHFDVVPFVCKGGLARGPCALEEAAAGEQNRFVLVPRAGERLVLLGAVHTAAARWESDGEGTWAYFGAIAPVESAQLVAMLDPGLPPWLATTLRQLLPDIFAWYAARTGQKLEPRPVVFLNFNPLPGETGVGIGGGTRRGSVQLLVDLGRSYVRAPSPRPVERIGYLFAHEGAHLWNNQMFPQDGESDDWMHEGGADAFAFRALLHFGLTTRARYEEQLSEAISTCLLALGKRPVRELGDAGRYGAYYACGSTFALWTEALVARAHPGLDLFDFWARLFAAAQDRRYSAALYYKTLRELAGPEAAEAIRDFVQEPHADAEPLLVRELGKLGIGVEPDPSAHLPERYQELAGRWAFEALVAADCGSAGGRVASDGAAFELLDATGCAHFAAGAKFTGLGGFDLRREGARAYDALVLQCGQDRAVSLQARPPAAPESVPCHAALAPRPRYLRVTSAPPVR